MKFTIKRDDLLSPLQLVAGAVERRQTMPILANLLFVIADDTLSITGTDLEVEIVVRLAPESTTGVADNITLPAKKLVDICRSLPSGATIEFAMDNDQRMIVKSGRSRFTLSTLPANDFPVTDVSEGDTSFTCAQGLIKRLVDRTSFAMAQQDVRYYLNGLLWELENNQLRCVATDGHRLAMCTCELDIQVPVKRQLILPRKGVVELSRLLGSDESPIKVILGSHHMRLETKEYTLTSKLVDGKFPDYQRVLPEGGHNILVGNREELKQTFARTAILSNEKYRGVRLTLTDGLLTVVANNPEQEEAEEEVSVDYSGDKIEIGFNVSYLQDITNVLDSDSIKMTLSDANSSALLENPESGGDAAYVVMPMRL